MSKYTCKHCGSVLDKVEFPVGHDIGFEYVWVCFNDECGYFKRGWDHMIKNFNVNASYRYMFNSFNNSEGPLPVFSSSNYKPQIARD